MDWQLSLAEGAIGKRVGWFGKINGQAFVPSSFMMKNVGYMGSMTWGQILAPIQKIYIHFYF